MDSQVWKLQDIEKLKKISYFLVVDGEYAVIVDCDQRVKRLFERMKDSEEYSEIKVKEMVKKIAEYLSKHVSFSNLLNDKLLHEPVDTLLDLNKRIMKKAQVRERKGCFSIIVKGKQGKPLELEV